jgi:hypothetical protein
MGCRPEDIKLRLSGIVDHRNRIVHEGDILRHKRGGKITHHKIKPGQVASDIVWLSNLVDAIEIAFR